MTTSTAASRTLLLAIIGTCASACVYGSTMSPTPAEGPVNPVEGTGADNTREVTNAPDNINNTVSVQNPERDIGGPLLLHDVPGGDVRGHWVIVHFATGYCGDCGYIPSEGLGDIATAKNTAGVITLLVTLKGTSWGSPADDSLRTVDDDALARKYDGQTAVLDPEGNIRSLSSTPPSQEEAKMLESDDTKNPVHITIDTGTVVGGDAVSAGQMGNIAVKINVAPGHTLMSNLPSRPAYFALRVHFNDSGPIVMKPALFPPSQVATAGPDPSASVFVGPFVVRVPYVVKAGAAPGNVTVRGTVRYQSCTDRVCFFPVEAHVNTTVAVK